MDDRQLQNTPPPSPTNNNNNNSDSNTSTTSTLNGKCTENGDATHGSGSAGKVDIQYAKNKFQSYYTQVKEA